MHISDFFPLIYFIALWQTKIDNQDKNAFMLD